jgi:hypothetical protein
MVSSSERATISYVCSIWYDESIKVTEARQLVSRMGILYCLDSVILSPSVPQCAAQEVRF